MAASNKLRVTPSHSMRPTTGLHRWHVRIPTYGRSVASKPAAIACDRGASPPGSSDRIECSAAVYGLYQSPVAYQTAPATRATSCNQLLPVPCLTDERESRFGAEAALQGPKTAVFLAHGRSVEPAWQLVTS